jgi:hypothetical protein
MLPIPASHNQLTPIALMLHMPLTTGDIEHVWKKKKRVGPIKVEKVQEITGKKIKPFTITVILDYVHH